MPFFCEHFQNAFTDYYVTIIVLTSGKGQAATLQLLLHSMFYLKDSNLFQNLMVLKRIKQSSEVLVHAVFPVRLLSSSSSFHGYWFQYKMSSFLWIPSNKLDRDDKYSLLLPGGDKHNCSQDMMYCKSDNPGTRRPVSIQRWRSTA